QLASPYGVHSITRWGRTPWCGSVLSCCMLGSSAGPKDSRVRMFPRVMERRMPTASSGFPDISISTERLVLRALEDDDAPALAEMMNDELVAAWTSVPQPFTEEGAR